MDGLKPVPFSPGVDRQAPREAGAMRFELFLAARYLKAKRRQAVVGVVTTISIAGVAAGVAALIIALAITNGMRRDLQERLLGSSSHVELRSEEHTSELPSL